MVAPMATSANEEAASSGGSITDMAKARALVRKLGSEIFHEREDAQEELADLKRLARPALVEAVSSDPDPEVLAAFSRAIEQPQEFQGCVE